MDFPTVVPPPQFPAPFGRTSDEYVPPSRIFRVLLRHKLLILGLTLAFIIPAAFLISRIPAFYDATTLLMLDTRKSQFHDLQATITAPAADLVAIATEVGIIRSPYLARQAVDTLNLTAEPEFVRELEARPSMFRRLAAEALTLLQQPPLAAAPPLTQDERRQVTAALLIDKLTILNDGKSYIITIRARTATPTLSASIANAYATLYLDFKQQQKIAASHRASRLLDEQLAPLALRVSQADQAVEAYRAKNGLILNRPQSENQNDVGGGGTVADQQLAQINSQLITATGDLAQKQANLRQIEQAIRTGHLDAIPEVVASGLIANLRSQQTDLSSRAASISQNQSEQNPVLRSALAAEHEVAQRISAEIAKIASSVRNQVSAAQAQVDGLQATLARSQSQVGTQSQANVSLRQLESEARAARTIYQDYLGRFEQTLSQTTLQEAEAEQISPAETPIGKSGPPRALYLALASIVIGALSCIIALIVDRMSQGLWTIDQLEQQTGLFGMGFIPMAPRNLRRTLMSKRPSIYNESVSVVSNLLQFGQERFRARVLLVTSALPREGKSIFAVSLAATIGREGHKALLVDCDMRRPSVTRLLGIKDIAGLGDNPILLREAVLPGLDVVTFRPVASGERPVISGSQIQHLLDEARSRYDVIVLDTPPVLPFADTPNLSLKADGAIMVVRWRRTPPGAVGSAVKMLGSYGVRMLGGVVTQVKPNEVAASDGGHAHMYRHYATYSR